MMKIVVLLFEKKVILLFFGLSHQSTIYIQDGTSDEASFFGSQKSIGIGDIFNLAHTAKRRLGDYAVEYLLRNGFYHFSTDKARCHCVDGDAFWSKFPGPTPWSSQSLRLWWPRNCFARNCRSGLLPKRR